jgi:transcription elongation factor GreA
MAGPEARADSLAWVTEDQTHLTAATHERLKAELEDLTTRGRVEIARAIEAARALGDLSENGDYHAAKDSQGKMEARIRQLQATLKRAVVVDGDGGGSDTVVAGTVVTIRYEGDDDDERFLVGSIEERHDELNGVSPGSPLGKALLGKGPGEVVEYESPGGTLRVEIVKVG